MARNPHDEDEGQEFGYDDEPEVEDRSEEEQEQQEEELDSSEEASTDEDIPASLPEDSLADEPDPYEEKPKKQRDKAKTRINQIQREKYQALHEADRLRQEVEQLRQMVDTSSQVAIRQYDDNVNKRLEDARLAKINAYEANDPTAMVDADARFNAAFNEMQALNNWKVQQDFERNQRAAYEQQSQQSYNPAVANQQYVQEWVQENEWFDPDSDNYDEDLATNMDAYSKALSNELTRLGLQEAVMSPHYFAEINKAAETYRQQRDNPIGQRRSLNMKPVRGGANPVRRGSSSANPNYGAPQKIEISADERDMARRMGVSDKDYLKKKIEDIQQNGFRRRGGR